MAVANSTSWGTLQFRNEGKTSKSNNLNGTTTEFKMRIQGGKENSKFQRKTKRKKLQLCPI